MKKLSKYEVGTFIQFGETFDDIVLERLSELSPSDLALYFAEGTLDKQVRPTAREIKRDRDMIADYVESHPNVRKEFYRALSNLLPPELWTERGVNWNGRI